MNITICPIKQLYLLEQPQGQGGVAAILCSSYPIHEKKVSWVSQKLILNFYDTINIHDPQAFCPELAEQIRAFVASLDRQTELYVCCDSGESRSTAIAAAIYRYMRQDEMMIWKNPHYHPNPLVYQLQCQAFGVPVSRFCVRYRTWLNHRARSNAIKRSRKG